MAGPALRPHPHAQACQDLAHSLAADPVVITDGLERGAAEVSGAHIGLAAVVSNASGHGRSLGCLSAKGNRLPKCADERQGLASLGMTAAVSDRPEETSASALFRELLAQSEWTHETLAAEVEVSPGRVSQWATNRGSIPWDKARLVAAKLNTKPALISPGFRRLRDEFLASHVERLDASIIELAIPTARKFAKLSPNQKLSLDRDAEAIAQAIGIALQVAIEEAEGAYDESTQAHGADRRIDHAARKGEVRREAEAAPRVVRKRAAGAA